MKRRLLLSLGVLCILIPPGVLWADDGVMPQIEMTHQSIRDRVTAMRQQRFARMPYLDPGFVRSVIRPNTVQPQFDFMATQEKSLRDLIDRAVNVHTPAKAAWERISLARRRILVAVRDLFPALEFKFQERDGKLSTLKFNSFNHRFTFRQPLFRGGILWNTLLKEQSELEASKKEHEAVILNVVDDVIQAAMEYSSTVSIVRDYDLAIRKMNPFAAMSQRKYDEEIISEIEHLNVQSLASQLKYDFETSKQELELAKLDLQKLLNIDVYEDIVIKALYDADSLVRDYIASEEEGEYYPSEEPLAFRGWIQIPDLNSLVDMGYQNRPELRVEAARLQSARLEERIKWGKMIPRADIVMEFGQLGEAFDVNSTEPELKQEFKFLLELNWNMAGSELQYQIENDERGPSVSQFLQGTGSQSTRNSFSVKLLSGLDDLADAKEAEVSRLDQVVELEEMEKEVIQEIKEGYFDYQKAMIEVKASIQRVDYRERLVRVAKHRLETNEVQISEYFEAEIDFMQERIGLHTALADLYKAKAQINHAIGMRDYLPIEGLNE